MRIINFIIGCLLILPVSWWWLTSPAKESKRSYTDSIKSCCFNKHKCDYSDQPVMGKESVMPYRECKNKLCNIVDPID